MCLDAVTLDEIPPPVLGSSPSLPPAPRFPITLDQSSLCAKCGDVTMHVCWFPDRFNASTPVMQHGSDVCIGGEEGEIAFINLEGFQLPDQYFHVLSAYLQPFSLILSHQRDLQHSTFP